MGERRTPVLRAESVYRALRRAIIEQALKPGMKLPEDSIGEQLGVSRTLVREAFGRLAVEGLVELKPNKGASVAYPTLEEARDVFEVRRGLERLLRSNSSKRVRCFCASRFQAISRIDLSAKLSALPARIAFWTSGGSAIDLSREVTNWRL